MGHSLIPTSSYAVRSDYTTAKRRVLHHPRPILGYGFGPELDLERFSKAPLRSQSTSATMTPPSSANICGPESYFGAKLSLRAL